MGNQVKFLTGSQSVLNGMTSSVVGTFYLTDDSHRLYVGTGKGAPALLNQAVKVYEDVNSLPTAATSNDFYYAKKENILCIYDPDSNPKWVQINPDTNTNTDTYITEIGTVTETVTDKGIEISIPLKRIEHDRVKNKQTNLADLNITFTIDKDNIASVNGISVGLIAELEAVNKVKIATDGAGADNDKSLILKSSGATSLTISEDDEIVISSTNTTYDLAASNNKITLSGSDNSTDEISLTGDSIIGVTAKDNAIAVTHKSYTTEKEVSDSSIDSRSFNVITGITTEEGHVTKYTESTINVPDSDTTNSSVDLAINKGDLSITITDSRNKPVTDTITEGLYYVVNGSKVYNTEAIDFYTEEEINELLRNVNAMVYKGTVGGEDADYATLPTDNVSIGDTYMVIESNTYEGYDASRGDLFIAKGTEKDGEDILMTVDWTHVPAGSDIDTRYKLLVENNKIILENLNNNNKDHYVEIQGGTAIDVETTSKTITVKHEDIECTINSDDESIANKVFDAIESIEVNDQGHITAINKKSYTLPTDTDTVSALSLESNNIIRLKESNNHDYDVTIANDDYITLSSNTESDTLTIGHKNYTTSNWYTTPNDDDAVELKHKDTFAAITNVARDEGGHITGATVSKFTLPEDRDTTYGLAGSGTVDANGVVTLTSTLTGSNSKETTSSFKLQSDNLKLNYANNIATINLEWGSFSTNG